jgi:hypothetical protein
MTFGIPKDILPVNSEGRLNVEDVMIFLETRKRIETEVKVNNATLDRIDFPTPLDVLSGRGRRKLC